MKIEQKKDVVKKSNLEMVIKEDCIFITPVADVLPLTEWDRLFKDAKKKGFSSKEDSKEFSDWNITLNDGV